MLRKDIFVEDNASFVNSIYEIKDTNQALIGTAEHALIALHKDHVFNIKELPKKYYSYSMCFRKEIGAHGINEIGLWRTHQFNKIEMIVICKPDLKISEQYFKEMQNTSVEILKGLDTASYQVLIFIPQYSFLA